METLKVFTAFSGYDSQCMALDRLPIKYDLVGWSEIDECAIAAHNAIYPQYAGRNFGDITQINWQDVPDFDLFTYSSPCQDFSTIGLQHGGEKNSGTRSSLLWECEKAIKTKQPKFLLMENVSALVSKKFIKTFHQWQKILESYGYTNHAKVLNALNYGVPQSRNRIFLVSILGDNAEYYFPKPLPKANLKDVLQNEVRQEYFLSSEKTQNLINELKQ